MKSRVLLIVQNNSFPFDKRVFREALSLKQSGYIVSVISPRSEHDKKKKEQIDGITVWRYEDYSAEGGILSYVFEYFNSIFRIYSITFRFILFGKINIIHVANPPDFFWPIALVARLFNIKFIYDQHDLAPEMSKSKFDSNFIFKILELNERLSVKFSNKIIVVNNAFKERLINKWNINPNKCTIIPNGPPQDFYPIRNELLVKKYENKRVVLYIGLMTVNDHIEVIIKTANQIIKNKRNDNVHFILVGDGDVRNQMENLAASYGIEDYIEFTGIVNHTKVKEYLYIANVCIAPDLPNGLNEYLTLVKVLEYMKCSKGFVAFNLRETVNFAQDSGLYATDLNDFIHKVEYLLQNPNIEKEMGKKGNKKVTENYLWTHSEKNLLNLYNLI